MFSERAWKEYLYWQRQDKKTLKKINSLLKDIKRNGNDGIDKAEPLKYIKVAKKLSLGTEFLAELLKNHLDLK